MLICDSIKWVYLFVYKNDEEDDLVTDKELKKLSRLELLELLLVESRENERLREELEKIKQENVIIKSAQHLNETSENLDETSEKLGTALQKVYSIISGLDNISVVTVEDRQSSSNDETDEFQEEQIIAETNEPEITVGDKSDSSDDEVVENHGLSDISKRLDAALELISSKIKETDRLAEEDEESSALYYVDEN